MPFEPISSVTVEHRVQFSETDMAGLVHFSNFFRYMERAETEFFRRISFPMVQQDGAVFQGWPRGRVSAKFLAPLYFEDVLAIHLFVGEIKPRSIGFQFRFERRESPFLERIGEKGPTQLAKGEMTTVLVEKTGLAGGMRSKSLPEELVGRIRVADPSAWKRPCGDETGEP